MSTKESLTACAASYIQRSGKLSPKKLSQKYQLPCGCETVSLGQLLDEYACSECDESYFYSFCLKEVVEENNFWHCKPCDACKEVAEWHCKKCNDCTFGLTLPCDGCGKKSPYMPE